nr:hypothetical protein [Tanacetum cinerariifolium]
STEAPTEKSKRVKRHAKKSTETPAKVVVIRETPEMPLTNKKEKVDVTQGKGIELLFQVALIEYAQFEEVRKKSMRDFHKTHPSGSGTVTKTAPTEEESSKSEVESWGNNEDNSNNEQVSSGEDSDQEKDKSDHEENEKDGDDEDETKITDKAEGDEDEEIYYITSQLYDDVDIRLHKPVDTDEGFVQEEV